MRKYLPWEVSETRVEEKSAEVIVPKQRACQKKKRDKMASQWGRTESLTKEQLLRKL